MPAINAVPNITPNAVSNRENTLLQSMRPGQSVTVEVVSSEPGMLTVKTPDGQTLSAEFPGATVMAKGDQLELTLLSSPQGEHPQFRLSAVNNQNVNITTSVMESKMIDLGVEPSVINVKAAEFLAERGVAPTPERLEILVKTATYFPELPASTALFAAANNITPTRSNISALAEWLAGDDLLGDDAQSLSQDVKDILKEASMSVKESVNIPFQNRSDGTQQVPSSAFGVQITQQTSQTFTQNFVGEVIKNPEFPTQTIAVSKLASFAEGLANMSGEEAQSAISEFLNNYPSITGEEKAALSDLLNNAYNQTKQSVQNTSNDIQAPSQPAPNMQTLKSDVPQNAQTPEPVQTQITAPEEQIEASMENPVSDNKTIGDKAAQNNQSPQTTQITPQNGEEIKAEAQKLLSQIEKLVVSIKNDNTADAEAIKENVKTQQRTADSIKEGMARIAGENSAPAHKAGDMATRIQLGNQIDNFYYCQVPFKMGENQNTAELYVFNRKKGNESGERINTTILIALETQRMGRVETVLRAEDNSLNLEFRVETDRIQKYLEKETADLKTQLEESSFNVVGIKVVRIDVPATPLNVDQLVGEKEEFELKTIDISV